MGVDPTPRHGELCDAILKAVTIADRRGDHLTGALLMQAYEAAGCRIADAQDLPPAR